MRKIIFIALAFICVEIYGQDRFVGINIGEYLKKSGFGLEIVRDYYPDTVLVIDSNKIKFAIYADFFTTDTNTYFVEGLTQLATSSHTLTVNTYKAWPFTVPRRMTFDGLACEVTTGGGSGKYMLGCIYKDNGNYYPGDLIVQREFDANGVQVSTVNLISDFTLYPHVLYWLVWNSDGTPTMRAAGAGGLKNILGFGAGANAARTAISISATYVSTAPATFPVATFTYLANTAMPILYLKQK